MTRHWLWAAAPLAVVAGSVALGLSTTAAGSKEPVAEASTIVARPVPTVRDGRIVFDAAARPLAILPNGKRRPISSILKVDDQLHYGEFVWRADGVPAGRIWLRIDLDSQLLSVFRGGHEIGTTVILYGADNKPTPTGIFPVLAKLRDHVSSIYDAPMPFTLRLTRDGIAVHGSNVRQGAATHGCIGVPSAFAAKLFGHVKIGDEVVIVRGGKQTKGDAPPAV